MFREESFTDTRLFPNKHALYGIFLSWVAFVFFNISARTIFFQDFSRALKFSLILDPIIFLGILTYRRILVQSGSKNLLFRHRFSAVFLGALSVSIPITFLAIVLNLILARMGDPLTGSNNLTAGPFFYYTSMFLVWGFIYEALLTQNELLLGRVRSSLAEERATRCELDRLHSQFAPHFIFNVLNGISAEISRDPDTAARLVGEFSDFLRRSLEHRDRHHVTVREELAVCEAYLKVQKGRFDHCLDYSITVDRSLMGKTMPVFCLQPLIENAIKHGLKSTKGGRVNIQVRGDLKDGWIQLCVSNTGRLIGSHAISNGTQLGLDNLRRRLDIHAPGQHRLELLEAAEAVEAHLQINEIHQ